MQNTLAIIVKSSAHQIAHRRQTHTKTHTKAKPMASIKISLYKSKTNADGTHPITLMVSMGRQRGKRNTGFSCMPEQWKNGRLISKAKNSDEINQRLTEKLLKTQKALADLKATGRPFTIADLFERIDGKGENEHTTIVELFNIIATEKEQLNKAGTARVYRDTMRSFQKFAKNDRIKFSELDAVMLRKYHRFLRIDCKGTTIKLRFKILRALYNEGINRAVGGATRERLPFGVGRFQTKEINVQQPEKRAITRQQIQQIIDLDLIEHPKLARARHYAVFSYFARGMNFACMARLKWSDFSGDQSHFFYRRKKTGKPLTVTVFEPMREALEFFRGLDVETPFVFPILKKTYNDSVKEMSRITEQRKGFNKELKKIGTIINVQKLSTYVIRHSYASNARDAGGSLSAISAALSHNSLKQTETYLRELDTSAIDEATTKLL